MKRRLRPQDRPPLTQDQSAALAAYRAHHAICGLPDHTWVDALLSDWRRGAVPGMLHALRNTHGPTWLDWYVRRLSPLDAEELRTARPLSEFVG